MKNALLSVAYDSINEIKAERLRQCATHIAFAVDAETGKKKLHSANFCRVRLCPMCQWRRSLKVFGQTKRIMDAIQKEKPRAYIFVTFTVRNCAGEDLNDTINTMMAAWNRLHGRKEVKQAVKGFYRGLEITHNTDPLSAGFDTFHPHFHAVFAVNLSYFTNKTYISQETWTTLWKDCAKLNYTPVVDARKVKGSTAAAVAEAAKYTVKSSDYIIPDDWDLTVDTVRLLDAVLEKRRLVSYGGVFADWQKKLHLDDVENGDLVHTDTDDVSQETAGTIWFAWNTGYKQYSQITSCF